MLLESIAETKALHFQFISNGSDSRQFSCIHVFKVVRTMACEQDVRVTLTPPEPPKELACRLRRYNVTESTKVIEGLVEHDMNSTRHQEQHDYNTSTKLNFRLPSVQRDWGKQQTAFHAMKDSKSLSQTINDFC